jgi:hypothetical protein
MRRHFIAVTIFVGFLLRPDSAASIGPIAPPITAQTLVGTWEGVVWPEHRIFVVTIRAAPGHSYMTMTAGPGELRTLVFDVTDSNVSRGGHVRIRGDFADRTFAYRLEIVGNGRAMQEGGRIDATLTLSGLNDLTKGRTTWSLPLMRIPGGMVNWIYAARMDAAAALESASKSQRGR